MESDHRRQDCNRLQLPLHDNSGAGGQIVAIGDIVSGKSVSLTAAKGNITVDTIGGTNAPVYLMPATIAITALNDIQNTGVVNGSTSLTEKTTSTSTAVVSAINVDGNIDITNGAGTLGTVTLTNSGTGALSGIIGTADISGAKSVTLTASKAGITVTDIGTVQASGVVKLTSAGPILQTGSVDAGSSIVLSTTSPGTKVGTPTGSITVANLKTGAVGIGGSISVFAAGGKLDVSPGAIISANSTKSSTKATVTLENKLITGATTGTIEIGAGANILTGGTGGGNINVSMGAPAKGVVGKAPSIATFIVNGNSSTSPPASNSPFFFSATRITSSSPSTTQLVFDSENLAKVANTGQIIFTTGKLGAASITIDTNNSVITKFVADPPAIAPVSIDSAPAIHSLSMPAPNTQLVVQSTNGSATVTTYGLAVNAPTLDASTLSGNSITNGIALQYNSGRLEMTGLDADQLTGSALRSQFAWISDTELDPSSIPAIMQAGSAQAASAQVGSAQTVSATRTLYGSASENVAPTQSIYVGTPNQSGIDIEATIIGSPSAKCPGGPSADSLELARVESGENVHMQLRKGNIVVAPEQDTTIDTGFATVKIRKGSVALIMVRGTGAALYNLDDSHDRSVVVTAGDRQLTLTPGRHVLITSHLVDSFELVNPAESFSYRNLASHKVGGDLQAFSGEFSIPAAIANVRQLRTLVSSKDAKVKRISGRMLKTAAILSQISGGYYRQYQHPCITALASR